MGIVELVLARHGECARDPLWPSLRRQTVPNVGHLHAAIFHCSVSLGGTAIAFVCVCYPNLEVHGAARGSGRADRFSGYVDDSISLELPIPVHVAEVLAEPAQDWGDNLGVWAGPGTPCICELGFCLQAEGWNCRYCAHHCFCVVGIGVGNVRLHCLRRVSSNLDWFFHSSFCWALGVFQALGGFWGHALVCE